jgi:hypothetical protein
MICSVESNITGHEFDTGFAFIEEGNKTTAKRAFLEWHI